MARFLNWFSGASLFELWVLTCGAVFFLWIIATAVGAKLAEGILWLVSRRQADTFDRGQWGSEKGLR